MAKMTKGQQGGLLGGFELMSYLVRAGCSVNGLTDSDYGFDFHVQLPVQELDGSEKSWELSAYSVLVQLKSSIEADDFVELSVARWNTYRASPTPVYLAGLSSSQLWIEPVELLEHGEAEIFSKVMKPVVFAPSTEWDPAWFLRDARARARIGSAPLRQWWASIVPQQPDDIGSWLTTMACAHHYFDGAAADEFRERASRTVQQWSATLEAPCEPDDQELLWWTYHEGVNPNEDALGSARKLAALVAALGGEPMDALEWGLETKKRDW